MTSAEKVRRHRARKRAGETLLTIKVQLGMVGDWLFDYGFIDECDTDNPAKVAAGLERLLAVWPRY
jgi:hypothetical protein